MKQKLQKLITNFIIGASIFFGTFTLVDECQAFPIYAQQAYTNPREANGRIVCANCHLAQKTTEIESPQSVLPDTVFEAVVKVPYPDGTKQLNANGGKTDLNVGAIVILPDGFKLAPKNRIPPEVVKANKGVYISPYSSEAQNILVVGPMAGKKHREITFPILSPDPATNKDVFFYKYPIYVGANRGRGQVNPNGEKTNNNIVTTNVAGQITSITTEGVSIKAVDGNTTTIKIPAGVEVIVKEGSIVSVDQPLTLNPNVGGFGQNETEIVLQSPARIVGYLALCLCIVLTQILLVIKKKQFEKVQAAEMNF